MAYKLWNARQPIQTNSAYKLFPLIASAYTEYSSVLATDGRYSTAVNFGTEWSFESSQTTSLSCCFTQSQSYNLVISSYLAVSYLV